MKWPSRFLGLATLFGLGASACTALLDTSDLTGGVVAQPQVDGSLVDGGEADAGRDAVTPVPEAAPVDSGPCDDVEATPRTFCAQYNADWGYVYCRDFDESDPIAFGWDKTTVTTSSSIVRDDCRRMSAPAALRSRVEANAPACSSAAVKKTVNVGPVFRVAFAVRLRQVAPNTSWFALRLGGAGCSLFLEGDGTSANVREESAVSVDHPVNLRFPLPDVWTRVWVDVDRPNRTVKVLFDKQDAMSAPAVLDPACAAAGVVAIEMGLQCTPGGAAGAEVLFDSVVVTGG